MSEETFTRPKIKGTIIKFKREKKKDKLKKMLGDNLIGITMKGHDVEIHLKDGDLSQSDRDKIQKIVDGE